MFPKRDSAPRRAVLRSTEMVEERVMINALKSGRTGDMIAARHLMYVMMN